MKDNSRLVMKLYIEIINQVAFENLGFTFETMRDEYSKVTFPSGWIAVNISYDGLDLIDAKGCSYGKLDFGCYPIRKGSMWLYKKPTYII